jgi:hypothetical protein
MYFSDQTNPFDHILQIVLNYLDPLASGLTAGLLALLVPKHVAVTLGKIWVVEKY